MHNDLSSDDDHRAASVKSSITDLDGSLLAGRSFLYSDLAFQLQICDLFG